MDVSSLSMSLSQTSLSMEVSTRVLKMAQDQMQQQALLQLAMMERSVQPNLGSVIDMRL
ncbi:MAG: YjfB family protein [Candidatus Pristimantibacillus sp.]